MAYRQVFVRTAEELFREVDSARGQGARVFGLFCGALDEATGESWCSDCRVAEPILEAAFQQLGANYVVIYCEVGDRDTWKNPENEFRKNPKTRLTEVPTLMEFGTSKRLMGSQCADEELVKAIFE